jgi:hypothetical protein
VQLMQAFQVAQAGVDDVHEARPLKESCRLCPTLTRQRQSLPAALVSSVQM